MPRGISHNNPGNIRISLTAWHGKITPSKDPDFETFDVPENGIRAIAKILLTYAKEGVNTITAIISKWAPSSENDTQSYINDVSKRTGFDANASLDMHNLADVIPLVQAIIFHENGECPYPIDVIMNGCKSALLT